ncbi:CD226 antigen isoform X2 [Lemur catta]|uniref:CD226 antigen isoform X2 n=1 Tax=Lemur catta TaxID=9447 RepID=UPI001E267437|nr:CD226 antigen isoform X2 [Lemur catta]
MDYFAFLLAILHVYKALCEEIFWDTTIKLAENMTLECVYPSTDILTQMEWFKINSMEKEPIAIFSPTHGVIIREPYADRVSFLNSTMAPNDITLSFHNASEADVGYYSCFVHTFPQGTWEKVIQVVQPGRNYTSKYQRQILTTCTQGSRTSFIIIPNVTASDSGLYRCCFQASTGENETFVMRLTVTEGKTDNQYILFMAGGTALLLLFVILITTVIVTSYNRRRRRQKRDLCKDFWDTQKKAPNNSRSPTSADPPTDDAREDIYVNYPAFSHRPKARV